MRESSAVAALYRAAFDGASWPHALDLVATAAEARSACLHVVPFSCFASGIYSRGGEASIAIYFDEGWREVDPRLACYDLLAAPAFDTAVISDRDIAPKHRRDLSEFRRGYLKKVDSGDFFACRVPFDHGRHLYLTMSSGGATASHDADIRSNIHDWAHQISAALRLAEQIDRARNEDKALLDCLTRAGIAGLFLDRRGSVIGINQPGEQCLGEVLGIRHGRLTCSNPADQRRVDVLLRNAVEDGTPGTAVVGGDLADAGTDDTLLLRAAPMDRGTRNSLDGLLPAEGEPVLVLLTRLGRRPPPPEATEAFQRLGLSHAEARVSVLVALGEAPASAAQRLGISVQTARTYLKRAYSKLGINKQLQLANLAHQLASFFPTARDSDATDRDS